MANKSSVLNEKDPSARIFNMSDAISIDDQLYINDLFSIPKEGYLPESLKEFEPFIDSTKTFCVYLRDVYLHIVLMFVTNWTMPLTQPLNFLLIILIYLTSILFLLPATLFLSIANYIGMNFKLYDEAGWQKLTTERLSKIRERGIAALGKPHTSQLPNFNLDLAETLLFLSSIVYLREETEVRKAVTNLSQIRNKISKQEQVEVGDLENVFQALENADDGVRKVVNDWNIQFKSVSELSTSKGVYAGLFWSVKQNFIVVSFKGTSPTNFLELVVNFTFQRKDGRSFLFGGVHEGFYNCLFPKDNAGSLLSKKGYPHMRIMEAINAKAKEIRVKNKKTEPVNIWITGHSLGASLATLFYSRLLKAPGALSDDCVLRDVYSFAALAVGDSNFSSEFSSLYNGSNTTLWRIISELDIAPHLPPNNGHFRFLRQYLTENDILNYFHVGDTVKFYHRNKKPSCDPSIFNPSAKSRKIDQVLTWNDWKTMFNDEQQSLTNQPVNNNSPIYNQTVLPYEGILKLPVLTMLRNHIPHRYFAAMEKSRPYFSSNSPSTS
ncbi:26410_t:CDS:2 [Dentiscutata erythropus]|uniref:26410_t:CDS:1 n=1 Tax=Dentiscutata erythropus TaxID=1348616 RepID=A0A9N8ZIB2_9GLOM|nr:26410_t:CDS:2 [Dentiscutata erythropus]